MLNMYLCLLCSSVYPKHGELFLAQSGHLINECMFLLERLLLHTGSRLAGALMVDAMIPGSDEEGSIHRVPISNPSSTHILTISALFLRVHLQGVWDHLGVLRSNTLNSNSILY